MFNEMLTGQGAEHASSTTTGATPERDETRTCAQCGKSFVVKASARNTLCSLCFVSKMEDEQRANQPFEKQLWQRKQRAQLFGAIGLVIVAILVVIGIMNRSDRRRQREDNYDQWRKEQGYKSTGR